jgi:hypothetical protein
VARTGEKCFRILIGRAEGRARCKLEDNIRMTLKETGWESVDWFHVAKKRGKWWAVVNTEMILWVL